MAADVEPLRDPFLHSEHLRRREHAAARVADGADVPAAIETMFANPDVACIHLHFAKQGCYAARVDRV